MTDELSQLFRELTGDGPCKAEQLRAGGSNRSYFRIAGCDGKTYIGVEGTSPKEDRAFCELARHLRKRGINVPEVLAQTADCSAYIQEDLGDLALFDIPEGSQKEELIFKAIRMLPKIQFEGAEGLDWSLCFPQREFDARMVSFDLNYFKYCFLKATGLEFHEARLEDDFERFADILLADAPYDTFMYRDFQARNVMVKDGQPWFIDFQGGRRGPIQYDVASFLWQARAAYPDELKQHLIDVYLESLKRYRQVDASAFRKSLMHFVLFRTLQVLGAYGYRGYFEHKAHFLQSIPAAMANLRTLLDVGASDYPYLTVLLSRLVEMPQFMPQPVRSDDRLTVRVMSFSYRKGIPQDTSGNGGGFVFDCRSMHNPGKYDEYKRITGADAPVIKFLEDRGEVQTFLENVYGLTGPAVEKYLKRGFTSLMVCFGCTGGQHRSLYCAEHTAAYLKDRFGDRIRVVLEHREQNICKEL